MVQKGGRLEHVTALVAQLANSEDKFWESRVAKDNEFGELRQVGHFCLDRLIGDIK